MRRLCFVSGCLLLLVAWLSPVHSFHAHMTAHMIVVAIAAPLLAIGLAAPLPFSPLVASMVELGVVWAWHTPALHQLARQHASWLVLEQGSFLASGMLLWITVLHRRGEGIVALLLTAMHMTLLGALIALSPRAWYPTHAVSPLDDQHLGGAIMLVIGGAAYLAGGLLLSRGFLTHSNAAAPASATD